MMKNWIMVSSAAAAMALTTGAFAQIAPEEAGSDDALMDDAAMDESEEAAMEQPEAAATNEGDETEEDEDSSEEKGGGSRSSKNGDDGARFRFGVAGGAGPLLVSDKAGNKASAIYGGVDLRFGVQINDLIGVYAQPQLGFYNFSDYGLLGTGGIFGASVGADVTLIDRFFVGAGLGYAVLNNPGGVEIHARFGGYPLMGRSKQKVRRKGLMVGVDFRVHLVGKEAKGNQVTGIAPTFNLGYEAF